MKTTGRWIAVLLILIFMANGSVLAADKGTFNTAPKANDGKKWRIGYYEGGEYIDYQKTLVATVDGLMELGWIQKTEIPKQKGEQTKELWNWLSSQVKSDYIEFVKDAHYSANWDKKLRAEAAAKILDRLSNKKDIDLIIAAGTWAGQDLANDKHQIPTVVVSTSNPLKAKIIKSIEDSGFDHVHARVDPFRYDRQVRIFHDVMKFKKLGVAYENTENGKIYGAIDKVEKIAKEVGFEIVPCYSISDVSDKKVAAESVKKCFNEFGKKGVDAIYVTVQGGISNESVSELVEIANSYRIPTFSQSGSKEVKYGFLISMAKASFRANGIFHAETLAKIFNGAKPRQLDQIFETPPKLAINLKTAELIGYDAPMEVLSLVDETYQEIEKPDL